MEDEITGIYITKAGDNYEENWLSYLGDDVTLEKGIHACGLVLDYYISNPMVNIKVETADGNEMEFKDFDLSKVKDPTHIDLTIENEAGSDEYTVSIA